MKKLLAIALVLLSISACAQHRHHQGYYSSWGWVGPTVIGGVIGYEIAKNQQPIVVQQVPPSVIVNTYEVVYINGIAYKKQNMFVNGIWQEVLIKL